MTATSTAPKQHSDQHAPDCAMRFHNSSECTCGFVAPEDRVVDRFHDHVFNPDHNLFCLDCGNGEIQGRHGIQEIIDGKRIYESDAARAMYDNEDGDGMAAWEATGNEFYASAPSYTLKPNERDVSDEGFALVQAAKERGEPIYNGITDALLHDKYGAAVRHVANFGWVVTEAIAAPDTGKLETVEVAADLFMALQREARRAALLPDVAEFLQMVVADNQRNRVPSVVEFGARELLARIEAAAGVTDGL